LNDPYIRKIIWSATHVLVSHPLQQYRGEPSQEIASDCDSKDHFTGYSRTQMRLAGIIVSRTFPVSLKSKDMSLYSTRRDNTLQISSNISLLGLGYG
jgi:hypothetical protein